MAEVSYAFQIEEPCWRRMRRMCALLVGLPDVTVVWVDEWPSCLLVVITTLDGRPGVNSVRNGASEACGSTQTASSASLGGLGPSQHRQGLGSCGVERFFKLRSQFRAIIKKRCECLGIDRGDQVV